MTRHTRDGCTDPTGRWWLIAAALAVAYGLVWWLT